MFPTANYTQHCQDGTEFWGWKPAAGASTIDHLPVDSRPLVDQIEGGPSIAVQLVEIEVCGWCGTINPGFADLYGEGYPRCLACGGN